MNEPKSTPVGHLKQPITWTLVFAVALQAAAALMWIGGASNRLARMETDLARHPPDIERLVRLEEQMIQVRRQLDRIENRITASDGGGTP